MKKGETLTLKAVVAPEKATNNVIAAHIITSGAKKCMEK